MGKMKATVDANKYMMFFCTKLWIEARMCCFVESRVAEPHSHIRLYHVCEYAMRELERSDFDLLMMETWIERFRTLLKSIGEDILRTNGKLPTNKEIVAFPFFRLVSDESKTYIGLN